MRASLIEVFTRPSSGRFCLVRFLSTLCFLIADLVIGMRGLYPRGGVPCNSQCKQGLLFRTMLKTEFSELRGKK